MYSSLVALRRTNRALKETLGIATTKNLDSPWNVNAKPLFPITEQVENSSVYYDAKNKTWYLFTNHIGIDSSIHRIH